MNQLENRPGPVHSLKIVFVSRVASCIITRREAREQTMDMSTNIERDASRSDLLQVAGLHAEWRSDIADGARLLSQIWKTLCQQRIRKPGQNRVGPRLINHPDHKEKHLGEKKRSNTSGGKEVDLHVVYKATAGVKAVQSVLSFPGTLQRNIFESKESPRENKESNQNV